jgi:hypothetical protein
MEYVGLPRKDGTETGIMAVSIRLGSELSASSRPLGTNTGAIGSLIAT